MPKRRTDDVVHAVMTDHYIQRRKPARNLVAEMGEKRETEANAYRGEVVPYYPRQAPDLYLAIAQVSQKSNLTSGIARLSSAIEAGHPQRAEYYLQLADAWRNAGELQKALPLYEEGVRRNPQSLIALRKFGAAARSVATLKRALQVAPDDFATWHELGLVHLEQGRKQEAIGALQKAIELQPDLPAAHNSLGGLWSRPAIRLGLKHPFAKRSASSRITPRHTTISAIYCRSRAIFHKPPITSIRRCVCSRTMERRGTTMPPR